MTARWLRHPAGWMVKRLKPSRPLVVVTLVALVLTAALAVLLGALVATGLRENAREDAREDARLLAHFALQPAVNAARSPGDLRRRLDAKLIAAQRSQAITGVILRDSRGHVLYATSAGTARMRGGRTLRTETPIRIRGERRGTVQLEYSAAVVDRAIASQRARLFRIIGISALLFYLGLAPVLMRVARRWPTREDREQRAAVKELERGIEAGELRLYYQPKIDIRGGSVIGVEALVRWQHPRRGLLAPGQFMQLAEDSGLIEPLTEQVLEIAVTACRRWQLSGLELPVAVNIAVPTLLDGGLVGTVRDALDRHGLPPSFLTLEITETAAMDRGNAAPRVFGELRSIGVGLSIDDFGTGHSSLARLRRLPLDELKIDRSFVANANVDDRDLFVARMIAELGRYLQLRITAEGVETEAMLAQVASLGCHVAQGFLFARPMPESELMPWLADWANRPLEVLAAPAPETAPAAATATYPVLTGDSSGAVVDAARRDARYNEAVFRLTRRVGEARSVPEGLTGALETIGATLGWEVGVVWLVDHELQLLRAVGVWEQPGVDAGEFDALTRSMRFSRGVGLPGRAWETGEPVALDEVGDLGGYVRIRAATAAGLTTGVAIPLTDGESTAGVIELFRREPAESDAELHRLFRTIGAILGQFAGRVVAQEDLRSASGLLAEVSEGVRKLSRSTSPDQAREALCRAVQGVTGAATVLLFEPSDDRRELIARGAVGRDLRGTSLALEGEVSTAVAAFRSNHAYFVAEAKDNPVISSRLRDSTDAASVLFQPLNVDGRAGAVLVAIFETRCAEPNERVRAAVELLGSEGVAALLRAGVLAAEAAPAPQASASEEMLGALPGFAAWESQLSREVAGAHRYVHPLAVVLVQLEGGDDAGADVEPPSHDWLRRLRRADFAARIDPSTLAVALPYCPPEEAERVARRIDSSLPDGYRSAMRIARWKPGDNAMTLTNRARSALASPG